MDTEHARTVFAEAKQAAQAHLARLIGEDGQYSRVVAAQREVDMVPCPAHGEHYDPKNGLCAVCGRVGPLSAQIKNGEVHERDCWWDGQPGRQGPCCHYHPLP